MATKQTKSTAGQAVSTESRWPFGPRNYLLLAVALVVIIAGYVALGMGSITLAPLLLVVGYCVLIPVALIIKDPSRVGTAAPAEDTAPR